MDRTMMPLSKLSREELLAIRPGTYADDDLLDLANHFSEQDDEEREFAVMELMLRSPQVSDAIDYGTVYAELLEFLQNSNNYSGAVEWSLRRLAFYGKDEEERDFYDQPARHLGEIYLLDRQWDAGLGIFTHLIELDPGEEDNYTILGATLLNVGQYRLAAEVFERGLAVLDHNGSQAELGEQFKDDLAEARAGQDDDKSFDQVSLPVLEKLRAALALPLSEEGMEKVFSIRPPLDRLLSMDRSGDAAVDAEILALGKSVIPDLIFLGQDQEQWDTSAGPWHAARLLNRLRAEQAPELSTLANWLDRTNTQNWNEWASSKIAKIGGYSVDELESMALDETLAGDLRDSAVEELVERSKNGLLRKERVVRLLRELLNRPPAETAEADLFTANVIGAAVDLKAAELVPEMQKAFDEDRVDLRMLDQEYVYKQLNLPVPQGPALRTDGLYLRLECRVCNRVREHFTRFVIVDEPSLDNAEKSPHGPYIIDHEFVCPKCGALEQYGLDAMEMFKLMQLDIEQIGAVLADRKPDKPVRPNPRVFFTRGEAFGRMMHPLDVIDEYRGRIALDPKNADLHSGLGNSLRFIGRYQQALESYHRAVELAPNDTTYLYEAATAEHDFGDLQAARALYERCVAAGRMESTGFRFNLDESARASMRGLQALDRGEMSPWEYQLINASGNRLLPPPRKDLSPVAKPKKDKRHKRH